MYVSSPAGKYPRLHHQEEIILALSTRPKWGKQSVPIDHEIYTVGPWFTPRPECYTGRYIRVLMGKEKWIQYHQDLYIEIQLKTTREKTGVLHLDQEVYLFLNFIIRY